MSASARPAVARWRLDAQQLEERGYKRCGFCEQLLPLTVSRCRRRQCPGYSHIWARDTMRKTRENLDVYGGLVCMISVTAPGEAAGLVWDRSRCRHAPNEKCDGKRKGCKVEAAVAAAWNERSPGWWTALNRVAKLRADRKIRRLGASENGGVLVSEWELQGRGVWHLHLVLAMESAIERAWAFEYVAALREIGPKYCFGFVDARPLRSPSRTEKAARYISKYLSKWNDDGTLEASETVKSAGKRRLNYVSRKLTLQSGCTMRALRNARIVWAWREGHLPDHGLDEREFVVAVCLLDRLPVPARAP